ncbi:hypothetical protein [Microbacterium proteolyticum]|uniref:hypothetical protein n=1 Tax=Microbacterium proteolyticum TaxID=1572644 RepID=UPI0035C2241F
MSSRIYLASSWRNTEQKATVNALRRAGHEVYDFRNPNDDRRRWVQGSGEDGFRWSDIDPSWQDWSPWAFTQALQTPTAERGFGNDWRGMEWAEVGVLLLPSGRSAHIEAGYFAGHPDKTVHILVPELPEPELMYKMADGVHLTVEALLQELRG